MFGYDDDRKWIKEGAKVAIINTGGWSSRLVGTSTIEKVLKTQIVLASGKRFKTSDLHEHGGSKYHSSQICSPTDPRVKSIKAEAKLQEAENAARTAVETWSKGQSGRRSTTSIREVIEQMQALLVVIEKFAEED